MNIMNKVKCISLLLFIVGGIHCGKSGEIKNLLIQLAPEKFNVTPEEFNGELKLRSEEHLKLMKPFFSEEEIKEATDAAEEYLRVQFDFKNIIMECDSSDNGDSQELIRYLILVEVADMLMHRTNIKTAISMQNANVMLQEAAEIEKEYEVKNNLEILKKFHHAAQNVDKCEKKIKLICKKLSESKNYEAFMKKVEAHQQKNQ